MECGWVFIKMSGQGFYNWFLKGNLQFEEWNYFNAKNISAQVENEKTSQQS